MFKSAGNPPAATDSIAPIKRREYEFIRKLVYERSRINLGSNKKELVMGRLSKRLRKLELPSYKAYCRFLNSPAGEDELVDLIDSISTNHTCFLREIEHFNYLADHVLPELCGENGLTRKKPFRVWSAACSSGEESYSIALILAEKLKPAPNGVKVKPGLVLIAPSDYRMILKLNGGSYTVNLKQSPMVWHQRPAIDALFKSAAKCVGRYAVAALLTGMEKDGAQGLLKLKKTGALISAQNEETCIVYGMPKTACELGAAQQMVPLPRMAHILYKAPCKFKS